MGDVDRKPGGVLPTTPSSGWKPPYHPKARILRKNPAGRAGEGEHGDDISEEARQKRGGPSRVWGKEEKRHHESGAYLDNLKEIYQ